LGRTLEIPIIIRSLAGTFALEGKNDLPLIPDDTFLATLDSGGHQVVNGYDLQWWTGRKPKDLSKVEILNASTLEKCLKHFQKQTGNPKSNFVFPAGAGAGRNTTMTHPAGYGAGSGTFPTSSQASSGPVAGCHACPQYKTLLSDILQDVLKFKNFASIMSTSSENLINIGIRRASAFNLLHEAAILKETSNVTPPAKASTAHRISSVARSASSEVNRLNNLPASSYKWTWGETLTEEEVLNLRRTGTRPGRIPHSGYDISLPDGSPGGEYSDGPATMPSLSGQHDDVTVETSFIPPPTDLHFPKYFAKCDHRHMYDPFQISQLSIPPVATPTVRSVINTSPAPAPAPASPSFLADASGSGIDVETHTNVQDLADVWTSGSESDNIVGSPRKGSGSSSKVVPAPALSSILADVSGTGNDIGTNKDVQDLADVWTSGSESENIVGSPDKGSRSASNVILDLADVWKDVDEETGSNPEEDVLQLADLWQDQGGAEDLDEEHSGDELAGVSYDDVSALAEEWIDSEDAEETPDPAFSSRTRDGSYGPEDFNFLRDDMFDLDDVVEEC